MPEVCKALEVSEQTYDRWWASCGVIKANEVKRLNKLGRENAKPCKSSTGTRGRRSRRSAAAMGGTTGWRACATPTN